MATRDPRSPAPSHPEVQGYGRDQTQPLSLDAALDDIDPVGAPPAPADVPHPSLALGTHEAGHRAARTKLTQGSAPAARPRTPQPGPGPAAMRPPIPPRAATEEPDRQGEILGSYRILDVLGRGGMGYVYRAEHVKLGREVALKLLRGDYARRRDAVARFFQEARTVNRVRHRNIVDVTDFVELDDGTTFIIMELLAGDSLGNWARTGIDLPRALAVLVQICDGLGAAHDVGVIHRDLKPDNIFIVPTADGAELVKLLDFGVAKLVNRDDEDVGFQTMAGAVIGTPAYMSPEQAGGAPVDPRSDIYSLGAIMYELFCGQPMFHGRSFGEYVRKHLTEVPVPPRATPGGAQLDPRIEALIMRCLEKDADLRFPGIGELREALLAMLGGMETHLPGLSSVGGSGVRVGAPLAAGAHSLAPLGQLPAIALQLPAYAALSGSQRSQPSHPAQAGYSPHPSYTSHASQVPLYGGDSLPPAAPRATPWWVWLVGGALAMAIGTGAAVWYAGRGDLPAKPEPTAAVGAPRPAYQPEPIAEPIAPTLATTAPLPPPVEVKLDSTPAGAVFADGGATALCRTPCTYSIDPRDGGSPEQRRYIIRSAGHQDGSIVVDLKGSQREYRVALEPLPPGDTATKPDEPAARPEEPVARTTAKLGVRPRIIRRPGTKPTAKPDEPAAKPDEPAAKPDEPAAKPDNPDLIDPGPREPKPVKKPPKKPPGTIDRTDTLDPFHTKSSK